MTTLGFFSVVAHREKKDCFLVRARKWEHLNKLITHCHLVAHIEETPHADYRFRIEVKKARWNKVVKQLTDDISYPNFKDAVELHGGKSEKDYVNALHQIWGTLYRVQENHR